MDTGNKVNKIITVCRTREVPIGKEKSWLLGVSKDAAMRLKELQEQYPNVKNMTMILRLSPENLVKILPDGCFSQDITSEERNQFLEKMRRHSIAGAEKGKSSQVTLEQKVQP